MQCCFYILVRKVQCWFYTFLLKKTLNDFNFYRFNLFKGYSIVQYNFSVIKKIWNREEDVLKEHDNSVAKAPPPWQFPQRNMKGKKKWFHNLTKSPLSNGSNIPQSWSAIAYSKHPNISTSSMTTFQDIPSVNFYSQAVLSNDVLQPKQSSLDN